MMSERSRSERSGSDWLCSGRSRLEQSMMEVEAVFGWSSLGHSGCGHSGFGQSGFGLTVLCWSGRCCSSF